MRTDLRGFSRHNNWKVVSGIVVHWCTAIHDRKECVATGEDEEGDAKHDGEEKAETSEINEHVFGIERVQNVVWNALWFRVREEEKEEKKKRVGREGGEE